MTFFQFSNILRVCELFVIIHPKTQEQINVLKAFMQALKIKFEVSEEEAYNPDFVTKIQEGRRQVREGKTVKIDLDDIWKDSKPF